MIIRAARPEDAPVLSALAFAAKSGWGYEARDLERWRPQLAVSAESLADLTVLVAEEDGEAQGFGALRAAGHRWTVEHLWVHPTHWRRGIGRALVADAMAHAGAAGAAGLEIESDPHAEGFYRRLGAQRVGAVPAPTADEPGRVLPRLHLDLRPFD